MTIPPHRPRRVRADDVCGRRVIDTGGRDLGEVEDLIVVAEYDAGLLWVTAGDLARSDQTSFLLPAGVVTRVTADAVYIDRTAGEVAAAPRYNPGVPEEAYLDALTRYYARGWRPAARAVGGDGRT